MILVENIGCWGLSHALRGMRNPMNSWDKSDSDTIYDKDGLCINLGVKDFELMKRLYRAGAEHRKYLRQIFASMDIVAPLYWWKQFDTYKIGITENSCSTMHKIAAKEFELDDFSHEHLNEPMIKMLKNLIEHLNYYREEYNAHNSKDDWWQMIQMLPESYNQRRTVTMNYENVMNIIDQRANHKLPEWNDFCNETLLNLPLIKEIRAE